MCRSFPLIGLCIQVGLCGNIPALLSDRGMASHFQQNLLLEGGGEWVAARSLGAQAKKRGRGKQRESVLSLCFFLAIGSIGGGPALGSSSFAAIYALPMWSYHRTARSQPSQGGEDGLFRRKKKQKQKEKKKTRREALTLRGFHLRHSLCQSRKPHLRAGKTPKPGCLES